MSGVTLYLKEIRKSDLVNVSGVLRGNPQSNRIVSIYFYFRCKDGKFRKFSEQKIKEKDWIESDPKRSISQRVEPKVRGAKEINFVLDEIESKLNRVIREKQSSLSPVFLSDLESCLSIHPDLVLTIENNFHDLFDEFISESKSRINGKKSEILVSGTVRHYQSTQNTIKDFEKKSGYKVSFEKINADFYSKFRSYCLNEKDFSPNTFGSKIKKLKTFLYWCQERDVPLSNKFWKFEVPQSYAEAEPLAGKELLDLWDKKCNWKMDVFLALCSTAMRISDYNRVMTNMDKYIMETKLGKALVFKAQKTGELCIVPLFDDIYFRPLYLYNKYNGKMPSLSGQKLNDFLNDQEFIKRIRITSKTGRKTHCSIKYYEQGVEAQFIMKTTGHKSESEFKKYIGANVDQVLKAHLEKATFAPQLKAS